MRGGSLTRYDPYQGLGGQRGGGISREAVKRAAKRAWKYAAPLLGRAAKDAARVGLDEVRGGNRNWKMVGKRTAQGFLKSLKGSAKRKVIPDLQQAARREAKRRKIDIFGS